MKKKANQIMKGAKTNQGEKKTTQRIPLLGVNGGLNNKKIIMKRMVTKEKRELWGIKRINERYKPKQLPTYNM